ncbi:MAG: hypothetical protein ACOYT4_04600 [Nanoarchaeota archaeon]
METQNIGENNDEERKNLISKLVPGINLDLFEKNTNEQGNTGSSGFFGGFDEMYSLECLKWRTYEFPFESLNKMPKWYEFVKGNPSNQVLIDLGCGQNYYGYKIAKLCGFNAYVGVDKVADKRYNVKVGGREKVPDSIRSLGFDFEERIPQEEIPSVFVQEGMLTFLRRLPSESVSLMTNGVDDNIIEGKYRENVKKEIYRCLSPNGFYLTDSLTVQDLMNIRYPDDELDHVTSRGVLIKKDCKEVFEDGTK